MPGDIGAVATLLSKVFGFVVDPDGYEQLKRDNKLALIARGIDEAIANRDWPTCDLLFGELRALRQQTGP
jgi:hypothetical protein